MSNQNIKYYVQYVFRVCIFGRVRKISKSDCWLCYVCPHGTTRLQLDRFSGNLIFEYFSKICQECSSFINLLKPTGYVMHQRFDIQKLYVLPTLYLCVLYLSENKQRLAPLITEMKSVYCAVRTGSLNKAVCASSLKG